jgi:hypothetical protein
MATQVPLTQIRPRHGAQHVVPLRSGEGQFAVVAQSVRKPKKKLIRRTDADRSQVYRRSSKARF